MMESLDAWGVKLAGLLGAAVSMKFLNGTLPERATTALAGAVLSYYSAPWVAGKLGMPEGLSGFLIGLFGMAICSRAWEWVQTTGFGDLLKTTLGRDK